MPYNRTYSLVEVEKILRDSELRPKPYTQNGEAGHGASRHSAERKTDIFSRPNARDSMILGSFEDYKKAVHEVLNSGTGQTELSKLNQPSCKSVKFTGVIMRNPGEIDILTKFFPKKADSQGYFEWLSTLKGEGYIIQIWIWVFKLDPPTPNCDIHIQTAYPNQYARIEQGNIMEII